MLYIAEHCLKVISFIDCSKSFDLILLDQWFEYVLGIMFVFSRRKLRSIVEMLLGFDE